MRSATGLVLGAAAIAIVGMTLWVPIRVGKRLTGRPEASAARYLRSWAADHVADHGRREHLHRFLHGATLDAHPPGHRTFAWVWDRRIEVGEIRIEGAGAIFQGEHGEFIDRRLLAGEILLVLLLAAFGVGVVRFVPASTPAPPPDA